MVHDKGDYQLKKIRKRFPEVSTVESDTDDLHPQHPSWKQDFDNQSELVESTSLAISTSDIPRPSLRTITSRFTFSSQKILSVESATLLQSDFRAQKRNLKDWNQMNGIAVLVISEYWPCHGLKFKQEWLSSNSRVVNSC